MAVEVGDDLRHSALPAALELGDSRGQAGVVGHVSEVGRLRKMALADCSGNAGWYRSTNRASSSPAPANPACELA
ncbi:MAG: hypothetical protein ACRDYX_23770 [Egibacteraceae bacterium]